MVNSLDYEGIKFPFSKKGYSKIEQKHNIRVNVFCYENDSTYPVYVSNAKYEHCMNLLLMTNGNKSYYVYIKDFNRFMCNKIKYNNQKHFCKYYLQYFTSKRVLIEHKENCLMINGKQRVKLRSGSMKYKIHFKQSSVPFKIYTDSECALKKVLK